MTARVVLVVATAPDHEPPPVDAPSGVALLPVRDAASLRRELPDAEALFVWRAERTLLRSSWDLARRLTWIQSASAGVDALVFPELVASDVVLTNARGIFDDAIAEWTLGAMLAFSAGILESARLQTRRTWRHRENERIAGRRLLIVGPGPIGRAIGRRALALGMVVSAVGRTAREDPDLGHVRPVGDLHEALSAADYVVDALPLADGTRRLFDAAAFEAMRPGVRFLNVGRGGTVDEQALVEALRGGRVAGAALDVFEREPLPSTSPLWKMDNVLVSPHMSGDDPDWPARVAALFADNLDRWLRGEPLRNVVDKAAGFGGR